MNLESHTEPYADARAYEMLQHIRKNCADFGIKFFDTTAGTQGVIHIVMPEQGIIHPGMTVVCGDSHTATHGAFGAIAFGIGTSQVRNVLATQTLSFKKLKVRRVNVNGKLAEGVPTLKAVKIIADKENIDMPICQALYKVVYEHADIKETIRQMFSRNIKQEFENWD